MMAPLDNLPLSRRQLLRAIGAGSVAAGTLSVTGVAQAETSMTAGHVVVAGSGLGGLALANRLRKMLPNARITVIDAKQEHNYQPGYTLVATGVWPMHKVRDRNADFIPQGVEWVQEMVAEFDPDAKQVTTTGGRKIPYDWLVVATGLQLDYDQIEGIDTAAIGQNGMGSVYAGPEAALATWRAMDGFRHRGGQALMMLPSTPLKCAGAPLKMTFMLADRLRRAGTLEQSSVDFHSALADSIFSVPIVNEDVLRRWEQMRIRTHYQSALTAVDLGKREATFNTTDGGQQTMGYDFLHVVPPMSAPTAVKQSTLAMVDGPLAAGGWLQVNKNTLQHERYANVFGVGDINGTPRGKTAATVKQSAPIVAHNLVRAINDKKPDQMFNGYTSCPMIVREGSAMLIEFDHDGKLTPSLPFIDPMQESFVAWFMKYKLLKPAYLATIKGRV